MYAVFCATIQLWAVNFLKLTHIISPTTDVFIRILLLFKVVVPPAIE